MATAPSIDYSNLKIFVDEAVEPFKKKFDETRLKVYQAYYRKKNKNFFSYDMCVPDVWRCFELPKIPGSHYDNYRINSSIKKRWIDTNIDINMGLLSVVPSGEFLDNGSIVFILESPHHHEYEYPLEGDGLPIPIAPAQNTTGSAILHFYETATKQLGEAFFEKHPLIIMNPVPWQTSLHFFHRKKLTQKDWTTELRNEVWKTIWKSSGTQRSFGFRLQKYHPAVVINACTKGHKGKCKSVGECKAKECTHKDTCLRGMVQCFLNDKKWKDGNNHKIVTSHHPSSAHFYKAIHHEYLIKGIIQGYKIHRNRQAITNHR